MQQERTADSASGQSSFAGLLASFAAATAPHIAGPADSATAALDGLEDDVATLSYERALQTHARYKPGAAKPSAPAEPGHPPATSAQEPRGRAARVTGHDDKRKSASVTVRMSRAEAMQLQQRAAEAGITVSGYLRSCAFEVEALRAQVKQTLHELRSAPAPPRGAGANPPAHRAWLHLFRRSEEKP